MQPSSTPKFDNLHNHTDNINSGIMAIPISKLDPFRMETEFRKGFIVLGARSPLGTSKWSEVKLIAAGAFGSIWLENERGGELRAVKGGSGTP